MDRLKTSEGFSNYIRYTRARDVDNRKGLQRSSDEPPWRRPGLRCCAVAGVSSGRVLSIMEPEQTCTMREAA
jgi:hypothetical protein